MIGWIWKSQHEHASLGPRHTDKPQHETPIPDLLYGRAQTNFDLTSPFAQDWFTQLSNMSTQYSTDIPFSASHLQQQFKLLELPPELLAALESENPPSCVSHPHANCSANTLEVSQLPPRHRLPPVLDMPSSA